MSVGYKDPVFEYSNFILFWKVGEEIIVSGNNCTGTFGKGFNVELAPSTSPQWNSISKRLLSQNRSFQIGVSSMSVTDNKEFH